MSCLHPALDKKGRVTEEIKRLIEKIDGVVECEDFVCRRSERELGDFVKTKKPGCDQDDEKATDKEFSREIGSRFRRLCEPIVAPQGDRTEPRKADPPVVQISGYDEKDDSGQEHRSRQIHRKRCQILKTIVLGLFAPA